MINLSTMDKVYFCTGARNHDLLKLFGENHVTFEYDERMASFKALGFAKATKNPGIICTTSGTAVAECVPALLEAMYSKTPLILISGDRPKKLHGTGSPQTIDHEILTRGCRGSYLEISLEEFKDLELRDPKFPLHINVLVDDTVPHNHPVKYHTDLGAFTSFIKDKRNPLFLFSHEERSMRPLIQKFAELKLPFYAECLSEGHDLSSIGTERSLVKAFNEGTFDCVVRVGHTPISKIWRLLEKRPLPVFSFDSRNLPALSYGEVLPLGSEDLIKSSWWSELPKSLPEMVSDKALLGDLVAKYPQSEVALMQAVHDQLSSDDIVYLGNSLIIRFFELVQKKPFEVHGNRGVNGIDGQLATAVGLASGSKKNVVCILGDVTTLYDLSSLREMPKNLKLIIMNNHGGRIFDMLKLDKRIIMEHEVHFKDMAQGMGLSYSRQLEDLPNVQVLELFPTQKETESFLREWNP